MYKDLLTMYRIAAMNSEGEDGTPSKQKQKKKSAGTETDSADGGEGTETVKEEAMDGDADGTT